VVFPLLIGFDHGTQVETLKKLGIKGDWPLPGGISFDESEQPWTIASMEINKISFNLSPERLQTKNLTKSALGKWKRKFLIAIDGGPLHFTMEQRFFRTCLFRIAIF